jgi:hypothetical protein
MRRNDVKILTLGKFKVSCLKNTKNPEKTLFTAISVLNQEGCDWWISAGTAIGLYRDKDFIPSDTDIDIGIRAKVGQKHIEIKDLRKIRIKEWRGIPIQTVYIDDNNGCFIDICYYYEDMIQDRLICVYERGVIEKPNFYTKKIMTKYGLLPFLHPIEDYLNNRWKGWEIPKKNSKGTYSNIKIPADYPEKLLKQNKTSNSS